MICAITPNPALDLSGTTEKIVPNEKSYVQNEIRSPGGNAINAGRIIKRLRAPVLLTGFLGGSIGQEVKTLLDQEEVTHRFVRIRGNTRVNVTVSERTSHLQTRVSFPGPTILASEKQTLLRLIKQMSSQNLLLIGGSLPSGITPADVSKMIGIARQKRIPTLVDIPGSALSAVLGARPLFIKPNLLEFQDVVEKNVHTIREVIDAARPLTKQVPLICVSSVEGGALLVTQEDCWFGKIPPVEIKSTVGAGDSMVGAMSVFLWRHRNIVHSLWNPHAPEKLLPKRPFERSLLGDLLRWGLAAACATLSEPGMYLGKAKQIRAFIPQIEIKSAV